MNFCPKCRSFYDDAGLAFCLTDGIPLVEINQSNSLWNEGTNAVRTSQEIVRKQVRRQNFSKITRILVTIILIAMSIYVVAMNIYVNIPTKGDEVAKNITPSLTPTATPTFMPTPETTIEQTPSPSVSPTPTQSLTQTPTPTPTATETPTPTPTKTPVPNPTTPIPPGDPCIHQLEQQKSILIKNNTSFFRSIIEREKGEIIGEYQRTQRKAATTEPTLGRINIQFDGCNKATVIVPYFWTIFPQSPAAVIEPSIKLPAKEKRFFCQGSNTWKCEPL